MIRRSVIAVAVLAAGCAAPPIGLGAGALRPAGPGTSASASGSAGYGGRRDRTVFQVDGAVAVAIRPAFALETGMVYTQMTRVEGDRELTAYGGFPYLRPRVTMGPVSVAVALAGFAMGGGEGGVIAGIADAQIAYGRRDWAAYVGGYGLHHEVLGSSMTSASQLRIGGEYLLATRGGRVGVAIELYRQADTLSAVDDERTHTVRSKLIGGAIKLRFASEWWKL